MRSDIERYADANAARVSASLRRHRLVFVQLGAAFECARSPLIAALAGSAVDAGRVVEDPALPDASCGAVIVDGIEALLEGGDGGVGRLGALRERVMGYLDAGPDVCLVSRAPKTAFEAAPGSSIMSDSVQVYLSLVDEVESLRVDETRPGWRLPAVGLGGAEWAVVLPRMLAELGVSTLGAFDSAVFESHLVDGTSLTLLRALDLEALRGAGIITADSLHEYEYSVHRVGDLRDAIGDVLSSMTTPQSGLAEVVSGLWSIERTIRHRARAAAIAEYGAKWRSQALHGSLPATVMERACGDVYPAARSIREIRDPFEWLTLGELLEVVDKEPYVGLGAKSVVWRKLAGDLLPIRNRLTHMRLLRANDPDTVRLWEIQAHRMFD